MNTRWIKLVLGIFLAAFPAFSAPVRMAVVPVENRTGDTGLDYLEDLIFNRLVVELYRDRDLELLERGRADLVFREQRLSPEVLADIRTVVPADLIVGGAFFSEPEEEKKSIELTARWLGKTGGENTARREISSFEPAAVLSAVEELARATLVREFGGEEKEPGGGESRIAGKKVAVTGFNNYSSRTEYDPLQKGIIYLLEERLGRNPLLQVLERDKLKEISREVMLTGTLGGARPDLSLPSADLLVSGCFAFVGKEFLLLARVIEVPSTRIAAVFFRRGPVSAVAATVREAVEEIGDRLAGGRAESAPAAIYPATSEALLYYARGAELYDRGEYLPAIENFNRAVAVDPGYTFGSYQAGRIYEEYLNLPGRAAGAYRQVLAGAGGPELREKTLLRLGMLSWIRLDDPEGAIGYFEEFLDEFTDSAYRDVVLSALGDACRERGEYVRALEVYRRALDSPGFNPLRGSLLLRAGQCLDRLEDYPDARKYFQEARDGHGDEIHRSEAGARPVTVGEEAERYLSRLK